MDQAPLAFLGREGTEVDRLFDVCHCVKLSGLIMRFDVSFTFATVVRASLYGSRANFALRFLVDKEELHLGHLRFLKLRICTMHM